MVMLIIHVSLAVITLIYAGGVVSAAMRRKMKLANSRTGAMWRGTAATVVTGILLTVLTSGSVGRLCGSLCIFLIVIGVAHTYQRTVRRRLYGQTL